MSFEINPYRRFLGEREPVSAMAETAKRIQALFTALGPQGQGKTYAPGKWSARQIICHLADCEIAFGFRLRQTLATPDHVIQPFDQELWAKRYESLSGDVALSTFLALRAWNLALFESLSKEEFSVPATHPERGPMTFGTIVETMAGHDLNHLAQLETIAASRSTQ